MTILWIIEKSPTDGSVPTLTAGLLGDYAVRAFASVGSFASLTRLSRQQLPNALIIDARATNWPEATLSEVIERHLQATPIIVLGAGLPSIVTGRQRYRHSGEADALQLSRFIDWVLLNELGHGQRGVVRYRGHILDYENLRCIPGPGQTPVSLPRKEAQLLRLFFERPGKCLDREVITRLVWPEIKVSSRTIDSHISRLRSKFGDGGLIIQSVYGGGYRLD